MNAPISAPQHYAPAPCPAANEYAWLQGIHDRLQDIVKELSDGYPIISTPDHIESAIRKGADMADDVYRQMGVVDEGE